ncbi:MAG: hypothetical protein E7277_00645 [Lachnospiraceae bacterium]|jgi:lysylphosphatidylglycerol synthetase-like protein (DUF2156 family)|nr:hypothetical protein [Lachnospiraceae bacterium]
MNTNRKKAIAVVVLLVIAVLSFTKVASWIEKPATHAKQIATLDEKKETVLKLTAVTTATSTMITVLPGDVATPIAEKLADVSGYLVVVLCAIFLEKYLLVITGVAVCKIMIPLLCLLVGIQLFARKEILDRVIVKLALFSVAICMVIPASVGIANMIERTYESSVQEAIDGGTKVSEKFGIEEEEPVEETKEESKSFWEKITGWTKDVSENVQDTVSSFSKEHIKEVLNSAQKEINNLIEAVAVMIVTSCLIPILVFVFMVWIVKTLLNIDVDVHRLRIINSLKKK